MFEGASYTVKQSLTVVADNHILKFLAHKTIARFDFHQGLSEDIQIKFACFLEHFSILLHVHNAMLLFVYPEVTIIFFNSKY